jgi:DNA-directed RNA polymerase subunit RPC12/RpoP
MAKPFFYKYKCPKCKYEKVFQFGDCLTPGEFIKKCPKCGATMEQIEKVDSPENGILDRILKFF